jgi:16S rRNA (adenine1518-N6/adenine1519-N6)-dimethyltransferase
LCAETEGAENLRLVQHEKTLSILKKYNIKPRKSLGQNFLVDSKILDRIIEKAEIDPNNLVIEIGPGLGTLTEILSDHAKKVIAVEIDGKMVDILQKTLESRNNVTILHQDFLQVDTQSLLAQFKPCKHSGYQIIANLPYYISTPIIQKIIDDREGLVSAVIMLQKEVAERIAAAPGGKEYGSLSVAVQYFLRTEIVGVVPKESFIPAPKVESAILRLTPYESKPVQVIDEDLFFKIVYGGFRQRRKTLLNNLKQLDLLSHMDSLELQECFKAAGIDVKRRGETLSMEEFARLVNIIAGHLHLESR